MAQGSALIRRLSWKCYLGYIVHGRLLPAVLGMGVLSSAARVCGGERKCDPGTKGRGRLHSATRCIRTVKERERGVDSTVS